MKLVGENRAGLRKESPYKNVSLSYGSDGGRRSGGCFYDYGAPKKASFTCYEDSNESDFVKSIV